MLYFIAWFSETLKYSIFYSAAGPVPVKAGIDFLPPWHGKAAGRVGRRTDAWQPLFFQLFL